MKHLLILLTALLALQPAAGQQPAAQTPQLRFVCDLHVTLAAAIDVGDVPTGRRTIIPITGGTFEGPEMRGEVVSGGADYQLHVQGQSQLHALYSLRTDDGTNILVDNRCVVSTTEGAPYFFTSPRFEAPLDSPYAWLNRAVFVCRPVGFAADAIRLRVWRVEEAAAEAAIAPAPYVAPPAVIFTPAKRKGRVEEFRYTATIDGAPVAKRAQVYLPFGYDPKGEARYNVLYLMHGGGDNTTSFFSDPRSPLPLTQVLDHLIADGRMEPLIVVAPTFYRDDRNIGANRMEDAIELTRIFHKELRESLVPAVETAYRTYLDGTDAAAVEASRGHRAFGGFSMGALTTWYQLAYGVDDVKYFLPLSGDLWVYDQQGEKQSLDVAALWLNDKVSRSHHASDFRVWGHSGSEDIAGRPETQLFEALQAHAPLFRIGTTDANAVLMMKPGGKHYYGDINEYLYWILPKLWTE